jgi:HSP20 family protein
MQTKSLIKPDGKRLPSVFNEFFKPWNEWFDDTTWMPRVDVPAMNISESDEEYQVSLAVPGMKKDDFKISREGNVITVLSEQEDSSEENKKKYSRREYSYSSFSRSFTLPEDVDQEKIDASYENGLLVLKLPRMDEKKQAPKQISVK